jgi:CheY-like chemotaxis protein
MEGTVVHEHSPWIVLPREEIYIHKIAVAFWQFSRKLQVQSTNPASRHIKEYQITMSISATSRILIADDDEEDIEMMENAILEIAPATELLKFSNGRMIQQYFQNEEVKTPCLVVLDYNMPGLTGAEVLLYMRGQDKLRTIPRVVLSTSSSPQYKTECLANGADEYIVKPDSWPELLTLAQKLVNLSSRK